MTFVAIGALRVKHDILTSKRSYFHKFFKFLLRPKGTLSILVAGLTLPLAIVAICH